MLNYFSEMRSKAEDTPPASPGFGVNDDEGDEMFEDEVAEEIELVEGEAGGDNDEVDEEELVELPGGIDQLETLMEEYESSAAADLSSLTFSGHQGSVFSCSVNYDEGLVATGGEDDKGFVWSIKDGEVMINNNSDDHNLMLSGDVEDGGLV